MQPILIRRRVIHLGGYDPMPPSAFAARFRRELARFAACWGVTAEVRPAEPDEANTRWTVTVAGPGWTTVTEHELVRWDDVIASHRDQPVLARLLAGLHAGLDFIVHGAVWRYIITAWRYALFFAYPYLALGLAFWLATWPLRALMPLLGLPGPLAALAGLGAGAAAVYWLIRHTHVGHLLDDWAFARHLARAQDPVIRSRLRDGAARAMATPPDEDLLIVGHSLGAVLAVDLIDEALKQPAATRPFGFLALGSSILKIALHGRARGLVATLSRMNGSGRVTWIEYQALNDVMNFYRSDPVRILGLDGPSPILRQVRFRRMLSADYYARIKRNFFRLHCQFISGNDRRAPYDYMMTIAGPFHPAALARSPDGAIGWLDDSGAITPAGEPARLPAIPAHPHEEARK